MEEQISNSQEASRKHATIKIVVIAGAVIIIAAVAFFIYQYNKNIQNAVTQTETILQENSLEQAVDTKEKIYTLDEKIEILNELSQTAPTETISLTEKVRILKNIEKQSPTNTIN